MSPKSEEVRNLEFHTLTSERWPDLEKLFGAKGACGGCWCMWWRIPRSQFMQQRGEGNRRALKSITDSGTAPGILAYAEGQPVGWCAVAPREQYPVLERSRMLKRVDDKPVWSIVCFFVAKAYRHKGITRELLDTAIAYVKRQDGAIVEGYPVEPKERRTPDPFAFTGLASAFRKAGFVEVLRRSPTRPIMRYTIRKN